MNDQPNQTTSAEISAEQLTKINAHLDALLGVDARKPGFAALLPAVIRITETLEAAGGKDFPVFPPSYAGDRTGAGPVYDLNGIEYGEILREKSDKDGTKRITRYIKRARQCTMDSPQSHANRTEIAFRDDTALRSLVPKAYSVIPRKEEFAGQAKTDVLALPHRVADFRVRASNKSDAAKTAISALALGDALPLLRLMPTSLVFGFWDSRAVGYQHKHPRILLTRIDAFNVVPCEKHSLYTGPYSKDECALVVLEDAGLAEELAREEEQSGVKDTDDDKGKAKDAAKAWAEAMASRGASNALDTGLGGVIVEGEIKRLALVSLTDIASIFCRKPAPPEEQTPKKIEAQTKTPQAQPPPDTDLTNAARRYLLALSLLAENFPRSKGSYRLRSGCELIPVKDKAVELRGAGGDSEHTKALIALCSNRELLIKVANAARQTLGIQESLDNFESDAKTLKADLAAAKSAKKAEKKRKSAGKTGKQNDPAIPVTPASDEATEGSTPANAPTTN